VKMVNTRTGTERERAYRNIGRKSIDKDIVKRNVLRVHKEISPAGRVQLRNPLDGHPGGIVCQEQNRPEVDIVRVEDLVARKLIVPLLSIAVQGALSEDPDIIAAPYPEGDGLLEVVVEVVRLPVLDVVGELDTHT
jgi:hypothetical protein